MTIGSVHSFFSSPSHKILYSTKEHIDAVTEIYNNSLSCMDSKVCDSLTYSFTYLFDHKNARKLKNLFKKVFTKCNESLLDQLLKNLIQKSFENEYKELQTYLLDFLSYEKMEALFQEATKVSSIKMESIKDLAETVAKHFVSPTQSKMKKSFVNEFKRTFSFLTNFIPNIINTFLIAFSLFDIGKDPQSAWEASAMLDVYYKFFMIPAAIVVVIGVFLPVVGIKLYLIAAAIVFVCSILLFIYVKWIRPCPNRLPHTTNLTEDAKLGRTCPVVGRNSEIDKLVSLFSSLEGNVSKHTILVGASGIGKTEIIKGFAQKIVSSKQNIPAQLRNKKVFVINTASLISGGAWGHANQLLYLLQRVKGFEKEVIFFFDEIHVAFKDKKSLLSDLLKPVLDRGGIHCIAATTTEEYNKYIMKDPAFARRFERMNVEEMDTSSLKEVLQSLIKEWSEKILIDDALLDKIIEKTNAVNKADTKIASLFQQPSFAVQVLTQAIKKNSHLVEKNFIPPYLLSLKSKLQSLRVTLSEDPNYFPTTEKGQHLMKEIREIELQITEAEKELKKREENITSFKNLFTDFSKKQNELKSKAAKCLKGRTKKAKKLFYFDYAYILPQMKIKMNEIKSKSKLDKYPIEIDEKMIQEIIDEMVKNQLA